MGRVAILVALVGTSLISTLGCARWPARPAARTTLTDVRQERRQSAIQEFELQRDRAQLEAAVDRWNHGDIAGCETRLRSILARRPDDVEAHVRLAELAWACDDYAEAEAEYRLAIQLAPQRADLEHALGMLLQTSGRHAEAQPHLARAGQLDPQNELFQTR